MHANCTRTKKNARPTIACASQSRTRLTRRFPAGSELRQKHANSHTLGIRLTVIQLLAHLEGDIDMNKPKRVYRSEHARRGIQM